jgi:hypothetical protein
MNTSKSALQSTRITRATLALALALASSAAACGDDKPSVSPMPDAGTPGADAADDLLPPPGGSIPPPPDGATAPPITLDASYIPESECCQVELSIADPDGNETSARLEGDQAPLDVAGGVALTHRDGRWRADVCLPMHTLIKYRFHFGTKLVTPTIPPDPPDAGADADPSDAGVSSQAARIRTGEDPDGGAGLESDGGDNKPEAGEGTYGGEPDAGFSPDASPGAGEPDAPVTTVEDYRLADDVPSVLDPEGNGFNLFSPVISCNAPGTDAGPPPPK